MTEKKAQSKADKVENKKERPSMAKANNPAKEKVHKAAANKDTVPAKAESAKGDAVKKTPVAKKAKAPVKKAASKTAASKEAVTKKAAPVKDDAAKKAPVADTAEKAKDAFAEQMDDVKSTATVAGHKNADIAKDANKKSESFEDAIATGLHEMKKVIHKLAAHIAEKTKE